jgi:hypothetical protein
VNFNDKDGTPLACSEGSRVFVEGSIDTDGDELGRSDEVIRFFPKDASVGATDGFAICSRVGATEGERVASSKEEL